MKYIVLALFYFKVYHFHFIKRRTKFSILITNDYYTPKYVYTVCTINANYSNNVCFVVYNMFLISFILYRLVPTTIVSGRYGPKEYATPQSKRRSATAIIGKIIKAIGPNENEVLFQNGMTHVVHLTN